MNTGLPFTLCRLQDAGANAYGNLASLCSASLGQTRTDLAGVVSEIMRSFERAHILLVSSRGALLVLFRIRKEDEMTGSVGLSACDAFFLPSIPF